MILFCAETALFKNVAPPRVKTEKYTKMKPSFMCRPYSIVFLEFAAGQSKSDHGLQLECGGSRLNTPALEYH